jgi:membrane-bound ClpP family serine protease
MQVFADIFSVIQIPALILFIVGLLLLIVEMFIPGFGIAGITGIVCLVLAAVIQAQNLEQGLILIVLVGLIIGTAAIFFFRSAKKGALFRSDMVLKEKSASSTEERKAVQPGDEGTAFTILRPAGTAVFGGVKYDVITQGDFIPKDSPVRVVSVVGNKIFVEKTNG